MDEERKQGEQFLSEIKQEFAENSKALANQMNLFTNAVAPYMNISSDISDYVSKSSTDFLENISFFKLKSCTVENIEEVANFLNERMEKLFTSIHALNSIVLYGIISRNGQANVVIGVNYSQREKVKSIINGLLTGIEIEEDKKFSFHSEVKDRKGGFISSVPILKVDEQKQILDISSLMKSLIGRDYSVLVYAKPIDTAQEKYSMVLGVKDTCYAVSKRNISIQNSINDSTTTATSVNVNRRSVIPELLNQIVRNKQISFTGLLDAFIDGGVISKSESISEVKTVEGLSKGTSFDIQNSLALEMIEYCDKATERMKQGQASGLWETTITYSADDQVSIDILKSCLFGELAKPTTDIMPLAQFDYPKANSEVLLIPANIRDNPLLAPITSSELSVICTPPFSAVPNFEVKIGRYYPMIPYEDGIQIGKVSDGQRPLDMNFALTEKNLNKHTFVCGITGSGKTTTVKGILKGANKPYLVLEAAKKEYRNIPDDDLVVYTLGKPEINCIQMNPFYVPCGISLQTHIDFLKSDFISALGLYGPMPFILEKCLSNIYKKKGWNITLGYHPLLLNFSSASQVFDTTYMQKQYALKSSDYLFPTMQDLKDEVETLVNSTYRDSEVGSNIKSAMLSRLESMCVGAKGYMFNTYNHLDMEKLLNQKVVFELEGLSDDSDKAFSVGLLVIFINEYRQATKDIDKTKGLKHLLVIEEAHRLLKNTSAERTSDESINPASMAIQLFCNMIAEMRSYGQGVIVAEQIPSKLAPDVIKNSSNKIVQRVVSADDQALIANTIGIKPEDSVFLGTLQTGHALCHKEGMSLPVFVKINPFTDNDLSDHDVMAKSKHEISDILQDINHQLILDDMLPALKIVDIRILNSLMIESPQVCGRVITAFKEGVDSEIARRNIPITPMILKQKNTLYGTILAELLLPLFNQGSYVIQNEKGIGTIAPNELINAIEKMCIGGHSDSIIHFQNLLNNLYKKTSKDKCIENVVGAIKMNYKQGNVDLTKTIRGYFYYISDSTVEEIKSKV